tara:strand:- start:1810 stop:3528 length:1719 start_codon:yes stop_codon:yes gene_type:complete
MLQDSTPGLTDTPPLPYSGDEKRRAHSRLRRRLLEGQWRQDLENKARQFFPPTTIERFGNLDVSRNLFATITKQLAVQYALPPKVSHAEAEVDDFVSRIRHDGLWSIGSRNARNTIGMREGLIRVDYVTERSDLLYRAVPSDLVYAEANPDNPDEPTLIVEARIREVDMKDGKGARETWTWDCLDIREGQEPRYQVLLPGSDASLATAKDISEQVLGGSFTGADYPYLVEGEPALPYSLYHAARTGELWNPYEHGEQVESTLLVACYWSFWGYLLRDASFGQRYGIGIQLAGGAVRGSGKSTRREVHLDPTSVALFTDDGAPGSGRIGQFGVPVDPERMQLAIDAFEQRTLAHAGLTPDDFQKSGGGAESGYAIALKRETVRRLQKASEAQFERADKDVLALSAALINANEGSSLPESGYSIRYMSVPPTPSERQARAAEIRIKYEVGLASPVDFILADNPSMDRAEAAEFLDVVREERVQFASMDSLPELAEGELPTAGIPGAGAVEKASDTALNGAQVQAATSIVERVALGALPRDAGVSMLSEFFNMGKDQAERVMGSVGRGFRPSLPG